MTMSVGKVFHPGTACCPKSGFFSVSCPSMGVPLLGLGLCLQRPIGAWWTLPYSPLPFTQYRFPTWPSVLSQSEKGQKEFSVLSGTCHGAVWLLGWKEVQWMGKRQCQV